MNDAIEMAAKLVRAAPEFDSRELEPREFGALGKLMRDAGVMLRRRHDERFKADVDAYAELEKAVRGTGGVWPDWVYEARDAIRRQNENPPHFLGELLAVLGWQGGTIHQALRAVQRLCEADKERNVRSFMRSIMGDGAAQNQTLTVDELTDRFYLVRKQRDDLVAVCEAALAAFDAASEGGKATWSGEDVDKMRYAVIAGKSKPGPVPKHIAKMTLPEAIAAARGRAPINPPQRFA